MLWSDRFPYSLAIAGGIVEIFLLVAFWVTLIGLIVAIVKKQAKQGKVWGAGFGITICFMLLGTFIAFQVGLGWHKQQSGEMMNIPFDFPAPDQAAKPPQPKETKAANPH